MNKNLPRPLMRKSSLIENINELNQQFNRIQEDTSDCEEITPTKDVDNREVIDLIESMTPDQFKKMSNFLDTITSLKKDRPHRTDKYNEIKLHEIILPSEFKALKQALLRNFG
ncbi:MAG: hypothetical protein P8N61_00350, partial [Porticoccaceae bacterium]|nr:hypothetical protein [Porticoccaceae bacterium]